jgi:hypothetical protein
MDYEIAYMCLAERRARDSADIEDLRQRLPEPTSDGCYIFEDNSWIEIKNMKVCVHHWV